jgi:DNA-binding CsgD family transcriptional regulator
MVSAGFASTLLERERELGLLESAWRAAVGGRGSVWLLCSEAGGGKTRLAHELVRLAGSRVLWGGADPVTPPDPYIPIARAIPGFDPSPQRGVTVERALSQLAHVSGDAPVLLVLDDLHFADDGSIAVVVRLSQACPKRPWLVIATYRPEECPPALALSATELVAQGVARRIDLPPLSRSAVARLVSDLRRQPVPPPEIDAIYNDSGGNPWFAEALARGNGAVSMARDRINLRLDRLDATNPGARALLCALAPAARPLPHSVVADLYGDDTPALRRLLTTLRDWGLLREDGDAWTFRHEILRRSVLDGLLSVERRDAHRRIAEALSLRMSHLHPITRDAGTEMGGASLAEVAMHFAEAGDARAVDWSMRAGREARSLDAHVEALGQFERAVRFARDPELRRGALRDAAREAYDLGRLSDIARFVAEALAIPGGTPEERAALHQFAARAARMQEDLAGDERHLTEAERLLADLPATPLRASIAAARVARAALDVQPQRLAAAAEQALRMANDLDNSNSASEVVAQIHGFRVVSLLDSGDLTGLAVLETALQLVDEQHLAPSIAASALANGYEECVLSLLHDAAANLYQRALSVFDRHELDWQPLIAPFRVLEHVQRGRYAEARELAVSMTPPAPASVESAVLHCAGVLVEARAGSLDRARALLTNFRAGDSFQAHAYRDLARLEVAMVGDDPALGNLAEGIYETMSRHRYARIAGIAAIGLAIAQRPAPLPPKWLAAGSPLRVLWNYADARARGDTGALRAIAARLDAMACPHEAALALRDAGDLGDAYKRLRAIEASNAREQLARALRAARQPIPRRTRSAAATGGLTDAERDVCHLVAAGAGNDEIASALGVSVRTVHTHLSRVYQKLGHSSRTALALWWTRQEGTASTPGSPDRSAD